MVRILFICKHNIFRSRIAEEYAKRVTNHIVSSAGLITSHNNMSDFQNKVCKQMGLNIPNESKPINVEELQKQDLVIIVANDISKTIFMNPIYNLSGKIKKWNIKDADLNSNKNNIINIINQIKKRVDKL